MPTQEQRQSHSGVSYEQLLTFLQDPASYPHRLKSVRVIQTPASFVALVFPYVYKVKKAVNFGFLDFSTPEKRQFFCEREVKLNHQQGLLRRLQTSILQHGWLSTINH